MDLSDCDEYLLGKNWISCHNPDLRKGSDSLPCFDRCHGHVKSKASRGNMASPLENSRFPKVGKNIIKCIFVSDKNSSPTAEAVSLPQLPAAISVNAKNIVHKNNSVQVPMATTDRLWTGKSVQENVGLFQGTTVSYPPHGGCVCWGHDFPVESEGDSGYNHATA